VDKALEKWGMAMGPFRMGDLAGNDIGWAIRKRRYVEKPSIRYAKFADKLCELGRYGQKTGKGWYLYQPGNRKAIPDPEVDKMLEDYRKELGITPRKISDAEIVQRCIFALVNEGARILEEGIAARASDIDMIYLTGYGFPLFRGGPMLYADEVGLYNVARTMQEFAATSGDAFWKPAPLIAKRVAEGKPLTA
jgi:3-hydroxyacyl-CoA dehydrogenase